ncbi:MAG TPA: GTP cyclohydrolase MptA [Thermoleophilaceae bacterium]|nr:GTP cyclohydrolase MptA [Thermoleophilaceae bacterium]
MSDLTAVHGSDVQARRPVTHLSLSRVGVTGVEKIIRISANGAEQLFYAELECFVDLGPKQKGAHMSRFEEVVNEAIDEVILREAFKAETLAAHIAGLVRDRQDARRAEVTIAARYPENKPAPVSGSLTQEIYTMFGAAVASAHGTRRLVGVQAQGMTACPCAQELVTERSRERLHDAGFTEDEIARVFDAVPVATHNQRGIGTLHVGCPEGCSDAIDAESLLGIVEAAMSSEIYELMKRSDEVEVVEKAHQRPRFVEDCVREMIRMASVRFAGLGESAFLSARQENLETIHKHNVVAERHGLLGELTAELGGREPAGRHTSMREWLDADSQPSGA